MKEIKDKKTNELVAKIAETPDEQKWENIKQRGVEAIAQSKIEIEINRMMM